MPPLPRRAAYFWTSAPRYSALFWTRPKKVAARLSFLFSDFRDELLLFSLSLSLFLALSLAF